MASQELRSLLKTTKGKKPKVLHPAPSEGLVPYIDISAVEHGTRRQWADPAESKVVPAGTLVMVWDGARAGWVGVTQFAGALGSTLVAVESPLDKRYLAAFLRSRFADINSNPRGSGIPHVNPDYLGAISIPVLSTARQQVIAELAEQLASKAEGTRHHLRRALAAIGQFQRAVLGTAVSGRLTAGWRHSNFSEPVPNGSSLSKQAQSNTSPAPNTNDVIGVPENWAWWTIEAVTESVIDYRGRTPPHQTEGPIPHIRTTQIRDGRIDWDTNRFVTNEVYEQYMTRGIPRPGDILFTMEAPMGEVGLVDLDRRFSIAQRILLLRAGPRVSGEFLALALQSYPVQRAIEYRSTGTGVRGISYKRLRSVLIPVPPLEEQTAIVQKVQQIFSARRALAARIETTAHRVEQSSRSVLRQAFRAELDVA
jgi:type I restriction enzyme S subunit